MNHFHNAKIIATMGPAIDKETVLSKVINNIDVFRINLSHGDEETKRKYIDTILKLDSSKTVMLDTKGPEIRTRNKNEMICEEGDDIILKYAEFFKPDEDDVLFMDYPNMELIPAGTIMSIDNDTVKIEILENNEGELKGKITRGGLILINRGVDFDNYIPKLPFLSEKDKKQIIRGIDNKINVIAISYIRTKENVDTIRKFLNDNGGARVKIIAKIETKEVIENIEEVIDNSDGIIINREKLRILVGEDNLLEEKGRLVRLCNIYGKPVTVVTGLDITTDNNKEILETITGEIKLGVDSFLLTKETAVAEDPIETVVMLYELINTSSNIVRTAYTFEDIETTGTHPISDYIIFNAYRASQELEIKAIICPTESGYTPARLSALKPNVPVIAFTKNDEAYRYINLLRGVKGYKIANTFEYGNIKQIGKEIIRILFKGSISLDDKIVIVHSSIAQNVPHMINGIELYKFKDI